MKNVSIKKLVVTALLTSLTIISTMFIRIPIALGYVNLGDVFVLLSVFILGPILGTCSAGVGSAIADLLGYPLYTPGTLVIKSLMAITAYFVYKGINKVAPSVVSQTIGGIVGAIVMAVGYFIYEMLFFTTPAVAIINMPWNLLQGAVGVVLSVVIMQILTRAKALDFLNK